MTTSALDVGLVRLQTLDKEMVDKWISQCHTNSWKKIQREIKAVFSSPSCLNGSFLDKSGDKHYQTSINQSGLDLSLAREVFKKLVKKGRVLAKVETVIQQSLLSNLSKNPVGVESLRVYLVLSELLTVISEQSKANTNDLIEAVAAAILRLHTDKLKVLEDLWSSLRPSTLIKHIKMWKNTLLCHLNPPHNHPTGFKDLLNVLQHLYIASQKSGWEHRVPVSAFCMEDVVFNDQFLWGDVQRWRLWSKNKSVDGTLPIVCCYPFLMNLQSKILALNVAITHTMNQLDANCMGEKTIFGTPPPSPFFELRLRRASLIEDTFRELDATNHSTFKKPLTVYFDGDSKVTDVYRRDFFLHVFDNLVAPESEMFMYNDSKTLAWFPATPTLEEKRYFLFGILCGLALLGNTIVHLPFPLALFKKLLNIKPSFEDLMEFCPHFAERLKTILDYPDDVLEELSFSFSVAWDGRNVELDPKEPEKVVTSENKREFVEAYVNHIFNKSVELVFAEFRRGFFTVCDEDAVTLFQPEELRGVMVGKENYDWETLKQNTVYGGMYNKSHPNIVTFWEVFEELSENQKKAFLLFLTGCDRVPILGMNQIRMQVQELYNSTEHHFPEALTCHSLLQLPMYPSKETLKARLTEALCNNRGFWKE